MPVLDFAGLSGKHQKPGMVPLLQRMLGNAFFGEVIIKIAFFHRYVSFLSAQAFEAGFHVKNPGFFPVPWQRNEKSRENPGNTGDSRKIYLTRFPYNANIIEQLNLFLLNRGAQFISTASEAASRGRRGKGERAEGSGCASPSLVV